MLNFKYLSAHIQSQHPSPSVPPNPFSKVTTPFCNSLLLTCLFLLLLASSDPLLECRSSMGHRFSLVFLYGVGPPWATVPQDCPCLVMGPPWATVPQGYRPPSCLIPGIWHVVVPHGCTCLWHRALPSKSVHTALSPVTSTCPLCFFLPFL